MSLFQKTLSFAVITGLLMYGTSLLYPTNLVFGNAILDTFWAIVVTAALVGFCAALVSEWGKNYSFSAQSWLFIYWVVNTLIIYVLARSALSRYTAIGISRFWVAILLGFVVYVGQYAVWKNFAPNKKK